MFADISKMYANSLRAVELEKLALLDSLTRLANRNYLEKELQTRFEEKKRLQISFGPLCIDIDHFKQVNDISGHETGDDVLRFIVQTFIANSCSFDLYGRWGEEFIGTIRNIAIDELVVLGDRLRVLIEHSYIIHDNQKIHVTVSMGATEVNERDTISSLIKRADTLLYESKRMGRNCLTIG